MAKYLTTSDMMDKYQVTRATVTNWRNEGMPFQKFGKLVRFEEDKVDTWLKERG